jgi:hypothetical protein
MLIIGNISKNKHEWLKYTKSTHYNLRTSWHAAPLFHILCKIIYNTMTHSQLEGCLSNGTMFIGLETSLSHSTMPGLIPLEKAHATPKHSQKICHSILWVIAWNWVKVVCVIVLKQTMTNVYSRCKAQQSYHVSHLYRKET